MKTSNENSDAHTEKRTFWSNHIQQWKTSGETQRQYCRQQQLVPHQFTYWKRRLSQPKSTQQTDNGGFLTVPPAQYTPAYAQDITLHLPNGVRIEGVNADNLPLVHDIMRWYP